MARQGRRSEEHQAEAAEEEVVVSVAGVVDEGRVEGRVGARIRSRTSGRKDDDDTMLR